MFVQLVIYCLLIALASNFGGYLASRIMMTHRRIQLVISFVAGVMLGVALLHLLPHSLAAMPAEGRNWIPFIVLFGLLFMFFMIRLFDFHQHEVPSMERHHHHGHSCDHSPSNEPAGKTAPSQSGRAAKQTESDAIAEADRHAPETATAPGQRSFGWAGFFLGLAVHSLVDGVALAAAVYAEWNHVGLLAGLSIFLAIALHKPLDALAITSLMSATGWSQSWQTWINLIYSLMCPLGALLFAIGLTMTTGAQSWLLGAALAFSAGTFLCISLSDLLPEVHFHSHDRLALSIMLILGIAISIVSELVPGHVHAPIP